MTTRKTTAQRIAEQNPAPIKQPNRHTTAQRAAQDNPAPTRPATNTTQRSQSTSAPSLGERSAKVTERATQAAANLTRTINQTVAPIVNPPPTQCRTTAQRVTRDNPAPIHRAPYKTARTAEHPLAQNYSNTLSQRRRQAADDNKNLRAFRRWAPEDRAKMFQYIGAWEQYPFDLMTPISDRPIDNPRFRFQELFDKYGEDVEPIRDVLTRQMNRRVATQVETSTREFVNKGAIPTAIANGIAPWMKIAGYAGAVVGSVRNVVDPNRRPDPNDQAYFLWNATDTIRDQTRQNLLELSDTVSEGILRGLQSHFWETKPYSRVPEITVEEGSIPDRLTGWLLDTAYGGITGSQDDSARMLLSMGNPAIAKGLEVSQSFLENFRTAKNQGASNPQALALGAAKTLPGLLSPNYSNMKGIEDAAAQARIQWFDYLRQIGINVGEANATLAWDRAMENRILGDNSPENLRLGQLIYEGYTPEEAEAILRYERRYQHLTATASAATTALGNTASSYLVGNLRSIYNEAVQNYIQTGSVDICIRTPGTTGEKAIPYSQRGIEIEGRLQRYIQSLTQNGSYIVAPADSISYHDASVMTAETGVEYTVLTIGSKTYLIRGNDKGTTIPDEIREALFREHGSFSFHTHPYIGDLSPSQSDLNFLGSLTWQRSSFIIEPNGMQVEYTKDGVTGISSISIDRKKDYYEELFK